MADFDELFKLQPLMHEPHLKICYNLKRHSIDIFIQPSEIYSAWLKESLYFLILERLLIL
jgi:hypothetical protein